MSLSKLHKEKTIWVCDTNTAEVYTQPLKLFLETLGIYMDNPSLDILGDVALIHSQEHYGKYGFTNEREALNCLDKSLGFER